MSTSDLCGEAVGLDPLELFAVSVGVVDVPCTGEEVSVRGGPDGGEPMSSRKKTSSTFCDDIGR